MYVKIQLCTPHSCLGHHSVQEPSMIGCLPARGCGVVLVKLWESIAFKGEPMTNISYLWNIKLLHCCMVNFYIVLFLLGYVFPRTVKNPAPCTRPRLPVVEDKLLEPCSLIIVTAYATRHLWSSPTICETWSTNIHWHIHHERQWNYVFPWGWSHKPRIFLLIEKLCQFWAQLLAHVVVHLDLGDIFGQLSIGNFHGLLDSLQLCAKP